MRLLIVPLALLSLSAAQAKPQTFTGLVTDTVCPMGNHSAMQMGPTDAECVKACIDAHGAAYMLYDGKKMYLLSDQKTPEKFAGKRATVTGTLDAKTMEIKMVSIVAAK